MTALRYDRQVLPTPDRLHLQRVGLGDTRSLRALKQRYARTAYAVAYGILLDPEAADQVVVEAFREVARSALDFLFLQRSESFPSWLTRLTRQRAKATLILREE